VKLRFKARKEKTRMEKTSEKSQNTQTRNFDNGSPPELLAYII
jgi:hypothetical protein